MQRGTSKHSRHTEVNFLYTYDYSNLSMSVRQYMYCERSRSYRFGRKGEKPLCMRITTPNHPTPVLAAMAYFVHPGDCIARNTPKA